MRIPPPIIFLAFIINGLIFQTVAPISTGSFPQIIAQVAGSLLIILAVVLIRLTFREFRRGGRKSAGRPRSLITEGPYRFSRNPMYLSAATLQLGLAVFLSNLWMVIFLFPAAALVTVYTVHPEERHLEQLYGQDYREYKGRVRRWI